MHIEDGPGSLRTVFFYQAKKGMVKAIMKLKTLFVALAAVFGMLFCANLDAQQINPDKVKFKVGTPSHAVKTFFRSMANADFATAKKYVGVKELQDMITMLEQLVKELPEMKDDAKKEFSPIYNSLKFKAERIDGNTAEVDYSYTDNKTKKTVNETTKLKKVNGVWKLVE